MDRIILLEGVWPSKQIKVCKEVSFDGNRNTPPGISANFLFCDLIQYKFIVNRYGKSPIPGIYQIMME